MLSISKINDAGAAHHYFAEKDDYYRADATAAEWFGAGAERAGLRGEIDPKDFRNVLEGRIGGQQVGNPGTRTVKGTDGVEREVANHAPGWDVTFSPPKSVSVAALVHGDKRLLDAHDRAVRVALGEIEKHSAMTRQRNAEGGYEFRQTGNLAVAVFRHASNRDQEPQVHSHAVVANVTFDPATGKCVSVWSRDGIYNAQREAGAAYTNELAAAARELGYSVDWEVNAQRHPSFELREIPEAERAAFSGRNAEIEAELARHGLNRDTATPEQKQTATLATRQAKEHVPAAALHAKWDGIARAHGFDPDAPKPNAEPPLTADRARAADEAIKAAAEQLSERTARFTPRELGTEARVMAQGRANEADLAAAMERARQRGDLPDADTEVRMPGGERQSVPGLTTARGQQIEKEMLESADGIARAGRFGLKPGEQTGGENTPEAIEGSIAKAEEASGYNFTPEQRQAVHGILGGDSGLNMVQGYAGTAKTTTVMKTVADHARQGGWKVRAMAPTASAAKTLGEAIGAHGETVAGVNARAQRQSAEREVWIVDEAGMVDADSMRQLLGKAEKAGARVLLAGDEKQIGSVGAGRAFGQIKAAHPGSVAELTDIKRQQNDQLRKAVYDSIRGDARAALEGVNVEQVKSREAAVEQIADRFKNDHDAGKSTLVVCLSRADRSAINTAIQQRLADAGQVRNTQDVATLRDRQWTGAERADASRYQPGDVIRANRDYRSLGLGKGDVAKVLGAKDGKVQFEAPDGKTRSFDPKRINGYNVMEPQATRLGEGDRAVAKGVIQARDSAGNEVEIKNGTELNIGRIEGGQIEATNDQGETFKIDASRGVTLDLAYAQTANQAQGRTYDNVVGYMRSSQTKLADQQRAYVTLSRARHNATIVTDDKKKLAEAIERNSGVKETAIDGSRPKVGDTVRVNEPIEARRQGGGENAGAPELIEPGTQLRIEGEKNGTVTARAKDGTSYSFDGAANRGKTEITDRAQGATKTLKEFAKDVRAAAREGARNVKDSWRSFQKEQREKSFDRQTKRILKDIDQRAKAQRGAIRRQHGAFSVAGAAKVAAVNRKAVQARAKVEGAQIREHARREARSDGRSPEWRDPKQGRQVIGTGDGRTAASHDHGKTWQRTKGLQGLADRRELKQQQCDRETLDASKKAWEARGRGETMDSRTLAREALQTYARQQANPFARVPDDRDWDRMAAKNGVEYDRNGMRYARDDKGRFHSEALVKRSYHMTATREGREVARETAGRTDRPLMDLARRSKIEQTIESGRRAEFDRLDRMAHGPERAPAQEHAQTQERAPSQQPDHIPERQPEHAHTQEGSPERRPERMPAPTPAPTLDR